MTYLRAVLLFAFTSITVWDVLTDSKHDLAGGDVSAAAFSFFQSVAFIATTLYFLLAVAVECSLDAESETPRRARNEVWGVITFPAVVVVLAAHL